MTTSSLNKTTNMVRVSEFNQVNYHKSKLDEAIGYRGGFVSC